MEQYQSRIDILETKVSNVEKEKYRYFVSSLSGLVLCCLALPYLALPYLVLSCLV
jgi:hypothetical protein